MLRFVLLTVFLAFALSERLTSPSFDEFMTVHERSYETEEEHNSRYWTFYKNMLQWELLNRLEEGTATYGMNQFSDLTTEEFKEKYLTPITEKDLFYAGMLPKAEELDVDDAPTEIDWREEGAVTPVKYQGECGSCWAFSTTGNIEGRWAIKTGDLISLSEQELVDCDKEDYGCDGGLSYQAYAEVMRLGGLVKESDYKYKGVQGLCKLNKSKIVVTVTGREHVSTNEKKIAAYVAKNGPVSTGINADMMKYYTGGVSHPRKDMCNPKILDHGVLIAGYGVEDGTPFWLIKNSWDTRWGEDGYYKIYRGDGSCGVNLMVTSAIV